MGEATGRRGLTMPKGLAVAPGSYAWDPKSPNVPPIRCPG
ncbi:hypothetical protein BVRB_017040, partial [Beta vulgaris subsp. vulgaris]